jgi:hypothetical protein
VLYGHLSAAPAGSIGGDASGAITLAYVNVLTALRAQIDELTARLDELLDAHPDAHIFRSLPRCATVRAATLLAEIGDCRARFPDAESASTPRRSTRAGEGSASDEPDEADLDCTAQAWREAEQLGMDGACAVAERGDVAARASGDDLGADRHGGLLGGASADVEADG